MGALRHHALLLRIDRVVCGGHHVPGGFRLPGRSLNRSGERVEREQNLRHRHKRRLRLRNVRCEIGMEGCRVNVEVATADGYLYIDPASLNSDCEAVC